MTKIEELARIIYPAAFERMDRERARYPADPKSRFLEAYDVVEAMERARNVLLALREPGWIAEAELRKRYPNDIAGDWVRAAVENHRAMIDAIIGEKP